MASAMQSDKHKQERIKVAIVGGGCAGMTAAFDLTRPELQGKFDVTVYQQGWRLGGKGASGRGVHDRIEEHGLHMWLGFYENSFRLIRECYAELNRDPKHCPIADWQDAFVPAPRVGFTDKDTSGDWVTWSACFPANSSVPGDPLEIENPFNLRYYLERTFELAETLLLDLNAYQAGAQKPAAARAAHKTDAAAKRPANLAAVERLVRYGVVFTAAGAVEVLKSLLAMTQSLSHYPGRRVISVIESLAQAIRLQFENLIEQDNDVRCKWQILDLVLAITIGMIRHRVILDPRGLDALDDYDCREWLRANGASESAVNSAFVRGLYDLGLAYEDGDNRLPSLAAGQGLRGAFRMFYTYRGHLFWYMTAGMGDVVFAPLYEVLLKRGVKFEFFHRLTRLGCSENDDGTHHIDRLHFDVQARTHSGKPYDPLIDVNGLPCWPARPDYSQLVNGSDLEATEVNFESHWTSTRVDSLELEVTRDFDFTVLAIGGGAVPGIAQDLLKVSTKWRRMVEHLNTVPTQAFQLWLKEDMPSIGWGGSQITVSAFSKPFDTWADMTHVLKTENWSRRPAAIAYFCGVLSDAGAPADDDDGTYERDCRAAVRANAVRYLNTEIGHLWPDAVGSEGFRWELLHAPEDADPAGDGRFDTQFWTANVNPSDRYVLALPGTLKHRISPLDRTFDNLTVAGDWTNCGFNEGCVEAAVMSGRLAAHALSGFPKLEDIPGYDHP